MQVKYKTPAAWMIESCRRGCAVKLEDAQKLTVRGSPATKGHCLPEFTISNTRR